MLFLVRYQIRTGPDQSQPLEPDTLLDDLPSLSHGDIVILQDTEYAVVGVPRLKRIQHPSQPGRSAMRVDYLLIEVDRWAEVAGTDLVWINRL